MPILFWRLTEIQIEFKMLDYDAPMFAVADARVVAIRDGIPESERISQNHKHRLEDPPGNNVVIQLNNYRLAICECYESGEHTCVGLAVMCPGQIIALPSVLRVTQLALICTSM